LYLVTTKISPFDSFTLPVSICFHLKPRTKKWGFNDLDPSTD